MRKLRIHLALLILIFIVNIGSIFVTIPNSTVVVSNERLSKLRGEEVNILPDSNNSKRISDQKKEEENIRPVTHLPDLPIRFGIERGIEDDVDSNTSNVDGGSDTGFEINFNNAQGTTVDSQYMQVQEALSTPPTIDVDAISSNGSTGNYITHNHTVAGENRLLIVTVESMNGIPVNTITYGGDSLIFKASIVNSQWTQRIEVWYLTEPKIGINTVAVDLFGTTNDEVTIGVISYTGVDPANPIDGVTYSEARSKTPSITVPSNNGDLVQVALLSLNWGAPTPDPGQTTLWSKEMGGPGTTNYFGACTKTGSSSVTLGWSTDNQQYIAIGMNINHAPAPYALDLEYQWTNADYTKLERELAIYTGNIGAETLKVDVWSGSSTWVTIIDSLPANGWKNVSVVPYLTSSTFTIRLRGANETDDSFSDTWNIDLMLLVTSPDNDPPVADNLVLSPDPLYSNDTLTLSYNYSDGDGDGESGTEFKWFKWNETETSWDLISAYTGESLPSSALFKGDTWRASVRPNDGVEFGIEVFSSNISVQNLAPILSEIIILPSTPLTTSSLTVSYTYFDPDGDTEDTGKREIFWYKDDVLQSQFNNQSTIPNSLINRSETWYYMVKTSDGENSSKWKTSNSVTIQNSIPTATNVNLTLAPNTNTDLNVNYVFADSDQDPEVLWEIRWYSNNGSGDTLRVNLNDLKTVGSGNTSRGEVWHYTLRVYDGINYSILYSSPSRSIINEKPTASNLEITQDPYTDTSLYANWTYSDFENDSESGWIVTWYRDGVLYTSGSQTMVPAAATAKDEIWNYTLQVFDGFDYSIEYTSPSTIILNTPPTLSNVEIAGSPTTTDDLVASYAFQDIDGDTQQSYQISWYKNGILQGSLTTLTVLSSETIRGQIWNYTLIVSDGDNNSIQYHSSSKIIINSKPYVSPIPTFDNTDPITDDSISIIYFYYDADNNDNASTDREVVGSRIIYWYLNGTYYPSKYNDPTLLEFETSSGDAWQYIISVFDGFEYSLNYSSIIVFIETGSNFLPTASNVVVTANTNKTTEDLTASYEYSDVDGLPGPSDIQIRWFANNVLQTILNDSLTVDSSFTIKNEIWNYTLRVYDGLNWSIQYNSSSLLILNSIPIASDLTITESPGTTENISINWLFFDDDSIDTEMGYTVSWFIDGVYNSIFDDLKEIDSIYTNKGQVWNYTVVVSDGENQSLMYSSPQSLIINSAPTVWNLSLTENPTTTTDLIATWDVTDPDTGDVATFNITWYRYGQLYQWWITSSTSATLDSGNTTKNEVWYFNIQATDGENYSLLGAPSLDQQIINTAPIILGGIVAINPSNPVRGTPLSVNYNLTDVDNDIESGTQIRWFKNNTPQPSFNDLFTIPGNEIVKGQQWHVEVMGSDGIAYSTPINSSQILIGNTAPAVETKQLYPLEPYTTSTLIASFSGTDVDGDTVVDYMIVWLNDSLPVSGLENLTEISPVHTKKGQIWEFQVSLFDGSDWSVVETFEPGRFILNSEPYIENITITGGANTSDEIVLAYSYYDPDGDLESGTNIDWTIFHLGSLVTELPSQKTLSKIYFTAGDLIYCYITPDDGIGVPTGVGVDSVQFGGYIFVGNSAPELDSQPNIINPDGFSAFFVSKNLIANFSASDPDQPESQNQIYYLDIENFNYRWYQNGILRPDLTGPIVYAFNFNKSDSWIVSVQPVDSLGFSGSWMNSSEIIISNSRISIVDIWYEDNVTGLILPNSSFANVTLSVKFSFIDLDGDQNPFYEILWYWNNGNGTFVFRTDLGNLTREVSNLTKGESWFIALRLYDGEEWSSPQNSSIIMIIDSPSVLSEISYIFDSNNNLVEPQSRIDEFYVENENIVLNYAYHDKDNDSEDVRIQWFTQFENGSILEILMYENDTLIPNEITSPGQRWWAKLTAYDESLPGMKINSSHILITHHPEIEIFDPISEETNDGAYSLMITLSNFNNSEVIVVEFVFSFGKVLSGIPNGTGSWYCSINLTDKIDTLVEFTVISYMSISGTEYVIRSYGNSSFLVQDVTSPRVIGKVNIQLDNVERPNNITIVIMVEEIHANISEISLFYQLIDLFGSGSAILQEEEIGPIPMIFLEKIGNISYYTTSLDIDISSNKLLKGRIITRDSLNNSGTFYFEEQIFYTTPPIPDPLETILPVVLVMLLAFITLTVGYVILQQRKEKKATDVKVTEEKLAFMNDIYTILVTSSAGLPIWNISNILFQADESISGTLSGLSVGIDTFLESFQADFISQMSDINLSRDHPEVETSYRISVIEQNQIQIMILGSVSYRIFVFLKEVPSSFLRNRFMRVIKDFQQNLALYDTGIINPDVLGPNIRRILRKYLPIGLLEPFKIDLERLEYFNSLVDQNEKNSLVTKSALNVLKFLVVTSLIPPTAKSTKQALLKLYPRAIADYPQSYSGILLYSDVMSIISQVGGFSLKDVSEALWMGIDDRVKILIPL